MYQKLVIVGRLGRDPEMRYMPDGTAVTTINVATDRRWTDKNTGQPVQETTWFRVSVWGRQAESVNQYLSKGSMALIDGHLRPAPQPRETDTPIPAPGMQKNVTDDPEPYGPYASFQMCKPACGRRYTTTFTPAMPTNGCLRPRTWASAAICCASAGKACMRPANASAFRRG